jgi:acyl-CoA thioester hydrolase
MIDINDGAASIEPTAEESHSEQLKPVIFEKPIVVVEQDIDGLGHANNVVYLRWVQEAATAHWLHSSTLQQRADFAWVAIRHEIDYLRPAFCGDQLVARTYVGTVTGVRFERFVEVIRTADNQLLARSRSVWVAIDPASKRPKRVDPAFNRQFFA